jgi:hypothetical protein
MHSHVLVPKPLDIYFMDNDDYPSGRANLLPDNDFRQNLARGRSVTVTY